MSFAGGRDKMTAPFSFPLYLARSFAEDALIATTGASTFPLVPGYQPQEASDSLTPVSGSIILASAMPRTHPRAFPTLPDARWLAHIPSFSSRPIRWRAADSWTLSNAVRFIAQIGQVLHRLGVSLGVGNDFAVDRLAALLPGACQGSSKTANKNNGPKTTRNERGGVMMVLPGNWGLRQRVRLLSMEVNLTEWAGFRIVDEVANPAFAVFACGLSSARISSLCQETAIERSPARCRAELIWDGKYDDKGRPVKPLRVKLPFQTIETVNESAEDRQSLFRASGTDIPWRNRLIWGDKKYVLPALLDEFAGKVNLIYIDPPFDTGADFSFTASVPASTEDDDDESSGIIFEKQPSIIEQKAYRDTWGKGLDSYLHWFYETVTVLHELLAESGSIYVHLDWHVGHYAKCVVDEVFGAERFLGDIIWQRTSAHGDSQMWGVINDNILFYSKSPDHSWNPAARPFTQDYIDSHYNFIDEKTQRRFSASSLTAAGTRKGETGKLWRGFDPNTIGRHWGKLPSELDKLDREGRIYWPKKEAGWPREKLYLDERKGRAVPNIWDDIPPVNSQAKEATRYATQKPEALLERIIRASSNENDLVLDCFIGSGTTAAVAEKLNRRWIACDLGRFAIHTTRKRLLGIQGLKPFMVQNLGKYERQLWQAHEFAGADPGDKDKAAAINRAYVEFILKLYHSTPVAGRTWLHGAKGGRMVHVGTVDSPVTNGDIQQIAMEFKKVMGTGKNAPKVNGVDLLAWEYAFELNEVAKQIAADANIEMRFFKIPRDVMDKRAVEQGDVKFFELAALALKTKTKGKTATLELVDFVIPPDDVPEEVRSKVTHWSQWIDFWAIDWDYKGDSFHNEWQSFRTRQEPKLRLEAEHIYDAAGDFTVMVKVIDILGNDTTQIVKVKVK